VEAQIQNVLTVGLYLLSQKARGHTRMQRRTISTLLNTKHIRRKPNHKLQIRSVTLISHLKIHSSSSNNNNPLIMRPNPLLPPISNSSNSLSSNHLRHPLIPNISSSNIPPIHLRRLIVPLRTKVQRDRLHQLTQVPSTRATLLEAV